MKRSHKKDTPDKKIKKRPGRLLACYVVLVICITIVIAYAINASEEQALSILAIAAVMSGVVFWGIRKKQKLDAQRRRSRIRRPYDEAAAAAEAPVNGYLVGEQAGSGSVAGKRLGSGYASGERADSRYMTAGNASALQKRDGKSQRRRLRLVLCACVLLVGVPAGSVWQYYRRVNAIPEALLEMAQKYPETAEFVAAYPKKKDIVYTIDLTSEIQEGTIPLFIQWDERWGYRTYGSSVIGATGCGPTCLSMVLCGLTGTTEWNPYQVAQYSQDSGYYVWGTGTSWDLMTIGAEDLGLRAEIGTISTEYIYANLSSETPMIASMYPGDFTYTGHFIVLTGVDGDGNITVNDPNSPKNSARSWPLDVLLPQIRSLWVYRAAE